MSKLNELTYDNCDYEYKTEDGRTHFIENKENK